LITEKGAYGLNAANSTRAIHLSKTEDSRPTEIEFEGTLRTILTYLPSDRSARIPDAGGGTGQYSCFAFYSIYVYSDLYRGLTRLPMASKGQDVTLVVLSSGLLSLASKRQAENPTFPSPRRIIEGNALHLDTLFPPSEKLDLILLLGPLYHIMSPVL